MKKNLLSLIFFILSFSALAEECGPINLISETSSPFQKIPVYNQEKINICYAYSAAQMADYHLLKNGAEKRNVHPAWVAMSFASTLKRDRLDIGHAKEALDSILETSNCDYETVTKTLKTWGQDPSLSEAKILSMIEENSARQKTEGRAMASLPTPMDLKDSQLTSVEMLSTLLRQECTKEKTSSVKLPEAKKYNFRDLPTDEAFKNIFSSKLSSLRSPISIAYCSNLWKNPSYHGVGLTNDNLRDRLEKDCHYHESLIVGQKKVDNSCQYLVRNTWGDRFNRDNEKWKCLCRSKTTGEYVDDCDARTHNDGNYAVEGCWIPADVLARNTGVVTVLE